MTEQKYIDHLERCFEKAERKESKLIPEVHAIMSMTGEKTRHFYNNLLEMQDVSYLEIGVWAGGSSCSAMYGNMAKCLFIDNWSGFGGPKDIFYENLKKFHGKNLCKVYEGDCFSISLTDVPREFNIYLFDGDHSEESQYKALDYFLPILEDVFIFIADDANWKSVRNGTERAIVSNNLQVLWKKEILLTQDNEFTHNQEEASSTWWNGIIVYLLKKT